MHRLIIGAKDGEVVDHRNRNGLDNRKQNLRICTHAENTRNSRPHFSSSNYKGVHKNNRRGKDWTSSIRFNGKLYHLGYFDREVDAARAYDAKAKQYFKTFAYLNFPMA